MFILSDCFKKSRLSQNQKCNNFFFSNLLQKEGWEIYQST